MLRSKNTTMHTYNHGKIQNGIFIALLSLFAAIIVGVTICQIIGWPSQDLVYAGYVKTWLMSVASILLAIIIFVFLFIKIPKISNRNTRIIFIVLAVIAIATEFFVAHALMSSNYTWDVNIVQKLAECYALHGRTDCWFGMYLAMYDNNTFITMVLAIVYKFMFHFFGGADFTLYSQIINSVAILGSIFLLTFAAHKLYGRRAAVATFGLGYALILLSSYTPITYTDTLGLFFVAAVLACAVMVFKTASRKRTVWSFLFGLSLGLGYLMKPTVAIIGVALVIVLLIKYFKSIFTMKFWRKIGVALASVFIGIAIGFLGYRLAWYMMPNFAKFTPTEIREQRYSLSHFLAIGSLRGLSPFPNCKLGGYCQDYNDYVNQYLKTSDEKQEYDIATFKNSVKVNFPFGYIKFAEEKTLRSFSDGSFGMWGEGVNDKIIFSNNSLVDLRIREFTGPFGNYLNSFKTFQQVVWLAVLLLVSAGTIYAFKNRQSRHDIWQNVFRITIIGLTLYLMLFESRARYLFLYLPVFILLAVGSAKDLVDFAKLKTTSRKPKR